MNITIYAQNILRLMAFGKYETIFDRNLKQTQQSIVNSTLNDDNME